MAHVSEKPTAANGVLARVQDVFRVELDDEDLVISPETSQKNLSAWDSLAHIRLVSGIENEFGIQFTLTEIEQIASVRQFLQSIEERAR
jgi:acyl carrier protein